MSIPGCETAQKTCSKQAEKPVVYPAMPSTRSCIFSSTSLDTLVRLSLWLLVNETQQSTAKQQKKKKVMNYAQLPSVIAACTCIVYYDFVFHSGSFFFGGGEGVGGVGGRLSWKISCASCVDHITDKTTFQDYKYHCFISNFII